MAIETIYDHPRYYDILFGWDRSREADFYHGCFERCGLAPGDRILEVACGPGRVARLLAKRGWRLSGLDSSADMLAFARASAAREGFALETFCAPMEACASTLAEAHFAAAYNPLSSFRLLQTDAAAEAHLRAIARALRPGGVYVLDLDLLESDEEPAVTTDESWEMSEGEVTVRAENERIVVDDGGDEKVLAWGAEVHLRGYTPATFVDRVAAVAELEIESWHPEAGHDESGVSVFDPTVCGAAPLRGRAMVVLRRADPSQAS